MSEIFKYNISSYKGKINPIGQYVKQMSQYLHIETGKSIKQCTDYIIETLRRKDFDNVDPETTYFTKDTNGDRIKTSCSLSSYIKSSKKENLIMVPSLTCYNHPKEKKSLLVGFLNNNVKERGIAKKKSFVLQSEGDMEGYRLQDNIQQTKKRYNNSMSGAFASRGTTLYNGSAHYTLTSITRAITSFGNAGTERMVAGNRHYYSSSIAMSNIISLTTDIDYESVSNLISKYNLHIPTNNDIMDMVRECSKFYWEDVKYLNNIESYVDKLSDIQRVVVLYTGDLFSLKKHNEIIVRSLIKGMSEKQSGLSKDPLNEIHQQNEYIVNLIHHIFIDDIVGMGTKYPKIHEKGILESMVSTCIYVEEHLRNHEDLIKGLFCTDNLPPTISHIKTMNRKVVVLSDTDSTCATYQDWVEWYIGSVTFDNKATAVAAAVMTIATQSVGHTLLQFSANMNVALEDMEVLAMKNEYYWDMMVPMNVSKHYFANTRVREGNVFNEPKLELKGAHLIASSLDNTLTKILRDFIVSINDTITGGNKIVIGDYIDRVKDIEEIIKDSIVRGDVNIFKQGKVNTPDSYKKKESSPYQYHLFWSTVFGEKYKSLDIPPYVTGKINTTVGKPGALKEWVAGIEDKVIQAKLTKWIDDNNKKGIGVIHIPRNHILAYGIPEEIVSCINTDKIITDICKPFYIILESLGYYKKEGVTLNSLE